MLFWGVLAVCKESTDEEDNNAETGLPLQFWGRNKPVGELCATCPVGAFCRSETYKIPTSLKGFYMMNLDISKGSSSAIADDETSLDRRERRNYVRAMETYRASGERVCPAERIFNEQLDATLIAEFSFAAATKRDFCLTAMPCKPKQACTGRNQCSEGYQYQELRCNASDARTGKNLVQSCNHSLQCKMLSRGVDCTSAISNVCDCPAEWELGGHACLKMCVRDDSKVALLETAGCNLLNLEYGLADRACAYENPEDCATCQSTTSCRDPFGNFTDISCTVLSDCERALGIGSTCEEHGECLCGPSNRCVLCSAGTHYRRNGKCEECPKNVLLLVIGFFFAIIMGFC